ncbi:MAG: hypothetical protein R3Y28_06995 [Candidatus Gastranaerophilales bacterium]
MERINKILLAILLCLFCTAPKALSESIDTTDLTTAQQISFSKCNKHYEIPAEKLFFLTLSSINANKFEIIEIQSKTGYVLFKANNKEFLATVVKIDDNRSLLKITPTDNIYFFPLGISENFFKYIELNKDLSIETISPNENN